MEQPHSSLSIAVCIAAIYSIAALVFASLSLSVLQVAWALPVLLVISAVAARAIRGDPATLKGIRVGLKEPGFIHKMNDAMSASDRRKPRFLLVAMPINHFGERVRWALDLIGAPYEEYTVGGLISAFFRGRSVPQLVDRKSCSMIGNSDECLAYLSASYVPFMEKEPRLKAMSFLRIDEATIAWDTKLNELGHLVQGWAYYYVLGKDSDAEASLTAWGAREPKVPWRDRMILRLAHPFLKSFMRMAFELSSTEIRDRRKEMIDKILDEVDSTLSRQKYLTGPNLSHVDITFSSLLAPLLPARLVWAKQSFYAQGRFSSFHGAMARMSVWPRALSEFEQSLTNRPCAKHAIRLYEELRATQLAST